MAYILVLGACSDMAKALYRKYAEEGNNLYLAGRNIDVLNADAEDLKVRYNVDVKVCKFDVLEFYNHRSFYNSLEEKPVGVIFAVGLLGDQQKAQKDFLEAKKIIDTNYTGGVSILNIIANDFEARKEGFIIGISSVAGDRGRGCNYIYGSAKAALTAYLSGLRNRLFKSNVQVLTVKPGFVATKMTEGLDLPKKLVATPEEVANVVFNAQKKGKDVVYVKPVWHCIMMVIKHIPECFFKKMSL